MPSILDNFIIKYYTIITVFNKISFERRLFMNKEEILERNKKSLSVDGDEMEILINGKANVIAKSIFTVTIIILILLKMWKGLDTGDLWGIFFVYGASESFYKYYCLKQKKLLITGILLTVAATCALVGFFLSQILGI